MASFKSIKSYIDKKTKLSLDYFLLKLGLSSDNCDLSPLAINFAAKLNQLLWL